MSVLDSDVASRLVSHLRNETTDLAETDLRVPASHFVSKERADAELALLRRVPVVAAHRSEIAKPGDFITRVVLGSPLIIVRQSDGSVVSYLNICRHRGGRIEDDSAGSKRFFMCRYHGWTYARDGGELRNVPFEDSFENIDRASLGMQRVKTEELHGFIWVDFSNNQDQTVAEYLGSEVQDRLSEYRIADCEIYLDKTFELEMNWKIVMDGALDTLHPKFLHPTGVGKLLATNTTVWHEYGRHGQLWSPRLKMADAANAGKSMEELRRYVGMNTFMYPNSMVMAAPDHVEFWSVWPCLTNPGRSTVHIRFLIPSDKFNDEMKKRMDRSWEILSEAALEEDFPMERSIQVNAEANPDAVFVYGRSELSCQHLHRQLRRDIDDVS